MLDQETLFTLGDIASSLREINLLLKDQKQKSCDRECCTISWFELEQFLHDYYGQDANIVVSRNGYRIDVFPRTDTDTTTTHG